jgi:hypothetical protein
MSRTKAPSTAAKPRCMKIEVVTSRLLDSGENLIWSGRPNPFEYAVVKCTPLVPVALFFAILFILRATGNSGLLDFPFMPFGVPFFVTGLYTLISLPWYCWRGLRARYFLTNRRAILEILPPFPQHLSVPLDHVQFVEIKTRSWRGGGVLFKNDVMVGPESNWIKRDGFVAIRDADRVAGLLRTAIDNASPANEAVL